MALEEGSAVTTRDLSGKGKLTNAGMPGQNLRIR